MLVLGYCGLRFGEAAALRVGDVNVWARRIRVSRSVTYVTRAGLSKGSTKTTVLPPCRCRSSWPRYSKPRQETGTTPSCCSGRIGAAIAQASLTPESTQPHDDATETALRTDLDSQSHRSGPCLRCAAATSRTLMARQTMWRKVRSLDKDLRCNIIGWIRC